MDLRSNRSADNPRGNGLFTVGLESLNEELPHSSLDHITAVEPLKIERIRMERSAQTVSSGGPVSWERAYIQKYVQNRVGMLWLW